MSQRTLGLAVAWSILLHTPKLYALVASTRTGGAFAGSVVNIHDHNAYLASVRDGMQDNVWLGTLSFTTEPNLPQSLHFLHASLFYRFLGWFYGFTGLPISMFYLMIGLILSMLAFGVYRRLFAECLSSTKELRLATACLFVFPGLLWTNQLMQVWPDVKAHIPDHILYAELWGIATMNPIVHNIYMPHFVAANICVALLGCKLLQAVRSRSADHISLAGCSLLIAWLLPSLGVLWVAIGASFVVYALVRWRLTLRHTTLMLLSFVPAGLIALWVYQFSFRSDFWAEYFQRHIAMNGTIDFWLLALHLGVFGPLAVCGVLMAFRSQSKQDAGAVLASIWLVWLLLLSLPGFSASTRFMDGVYLAAIVLASRVIVGWRAAGIGWLTWRFALVGFAILPGTLITYTYPWIGHIYVQFEDRRINLLSPDLWPIRLSGDESKALEWIEEHADAEDVVLAGPVFSSFVPGFSGARVYLGHIGRTLDFDRKLTALKQLDAQSHLTGLYAPDDVLIVDTAREPLAQPTEFEAETGDSYCPQETLTRRDVSVTRYTGCS